MQKRAFLEQAVEFMHGLGELSHLPT
jgi:hypothetical protein